MNRNFQSEPVVHLKVVNYITECETARSARRLGGFVAENFCQGAYVELSFKGVVRITDNWLYNFFQPLEEEYRCKVLTSLAMLDLSDSMRCKVKNCLQSLTMSASA